MKYVFFGSPNFAAVILEYLISSGMRPGLVVCNPDRPFGRKQVLTPPPTKVIATTHGIAVWQSDRLSVNAKELQGDWDLFVVAAYAKIIPAAIIKIPKLGTVGVHPSLLPRYRGSTPIQSAILGGDAVTGTTLFMIDAEVDHGPIIAAQRLLIDSHEMYGSLEMKLATLSSELLVNTLPRFIRGEVPLILQDHVAATFTKKFETEDGFVDLAKNDPVMIDRKVRALNPDPGVYTFIERKGSPSLRSGQILPATGKIRMKILETKIIDGKLELVTVQLEGKKPTAYHVLS